MSLCFTSEWNLQVKISLKREIGSQHTLLITIFKLSIQELDFKLPPQPYLQALWKPSLKLSGSFQKQPGFRLGKSCTSQLLNITQFIWWSDEFGKGEITGAVFVGLSAASETVNLRILIDKLFEMTGYLKLTLLLRKLLSNRQFFMDLSGNPSQWRKQTNGLPTMVARLIPSSSIFTQMISPPVQILFCLYADDLYVTFRKQFFQVIEISLTCALVGFIP